MKQIVVFDGAALPSGVYFYRIDAVGAGGSVYRENKKMQLLK
jgi:hypothetical protein